MADGDITRLTAHELVDAYRERRLSPVRATEAALARIDALDTEVNAFCLVEAETSLDAARDSEARWADGRPAGLLDGVPVAVKDVFLTRGWPTRKGSEAIGADGPWNEDAPAVARLREHGAVLSGKTTTPELGWKGVTDSPLTGVTGNPWDPRRTAGGSSGGSAAAVVLGMSPLATGTDGGGSIRIPAGFSGLAGIKPTFGRVPHYPSSPFGTLAHAGPMARTVADVALFLDVMAKPDPRDWRALPPPRKRFTEQLDGDIEGVRVAFSPTLGFAELDDEVERSVRQAVEELEALGAQVEETDPGFADPIDYFNVLWYAGTATALAGFDEDERQKMDPGLREVAEIGAGYSAVDWLRAAARRNELGVAMSAFHQTYDLLVTPTLPIPAFDAGVEVPAGWPKPRWTSWTPFTYPFNLTQQPAASVPCGLTSEGLPVGLQIVGDRHADALVLRAADAYERTDPMGTATPEWPGQAGETSG